MRSRTSLWVRVAEQIRWEDYELRDGSAAGYVQRLETFLSGDSRIAWPERWAGIDEEIISQGALFSAAEPAVKVLLAALAEPLKRDVAFSSLDLIFLIVNNAYDPTNEVESRCMAAVEQGVWILAKLALESEPRMAEACLEILDLVAPSYALAIREA